MMRLLLLLQRRVLREELGEVTVEYTILAGVAAAVILAYVVRYFDAIGRAFEKIAGAVGGIL